MKFYLLIIFIAVMLYFLLKPADLLENPDLSSSVAQQEVLAVKEDLEKDNSIKSRQETTGNVETVTASSQLESEEVTARNNMSSMLKQLSDCTEIKNSVPAGSSAEPTLNSILDSVQSELGEPVIKSEDWNSSEIKLADGSKRLLRIETVYEDDDIVKKLKYYQATPTNLVPIDLSPEQAINPSESFLASLEKEGEIVGREKNERVFFQNGEEISYLEKNGHIQNSEIIRAGKSLKCSDYGQKTFRCQCF